MKSTPRALSNLYWENCIPLGTSSLFVEEFNVGVEDLLFAVAKSSDLSLSYVSRWFDFALV